MQKLFLKSIFISSTLVCLSSAAQADYKLGLKYHGQNKFKLAHAEFLAEAIDGHKKSQYLVGLYLSNGNLGEPDHEAAKLWYEKSANQGYMYAQHNLGSYYSSGRGGTELNYEKAKFWFLKSAAQDDSESYYNLGQMYKYGNGYKQDMAKALQFFDYAADFNHAAAQYEIAIMYAYGNGAVKQNLKRAEKYLRLAVAQGNKQAVEAFDKLVAAGLIKK